MDPTTELMAAETHGGTALTIGVFDGVHRGHLYLLERVKATAARLGLRSAVITFRNHPRTVLAPSAPATYLTPLEQRLHLLRGAGIDHVIPVTFTPELSQLTPESFARVLAEGLQMRALLAGPDFAMGKGRAGTMPVLEQLGQTLGFQVFPIEPFRWQEQVISSSAIKDLLAQGDAAKAAELLGRPHSLSGTVVAGDRRGRALGFPTANIAVPPDIALAADGVYCTVAWIEGRPLDSVTSIGVRPTFGGLSRTVEAYVLDFQGDLYGKELRIDLIQRLRPELRFSGAAELIVQMERDVEAARHVLAAQVRR